MLHVSGMFVVARQHNGPVESSCLNLDLFVLP